MAKRFGIDLTSMADDAVRERMLREPVASLTSRMAVALLRAHAMAREHGHDHIGTEHVLVAILQDEHAIPSQILESMSVREDTLSRIVAVLTSPSYNGGGPTSRDGGSDPI